MSCEIKSDYCPFQIECVFPTETKGSFALYFYPSEGKEEQVAGCSYNGRYKCFQREWFNVSHTSNNDVLITVPDTFATRAGKFSCHKGDNPIVKTCPYPPPKICNAISSTKSPDGFGRTTKGISSSLTNKQLGNEGNSPAVPVAAIVVPIVIVVLIIIIVIVGILLFKKHRSNKKAIFCPENETLYRCQLESQASTKVLKKGRDSSKKRKIYIGVPLVITSGELEKSSLGKENTGNHVERSLIDRAPDSLMEVIMGTNNSINRDNTLTVNEKTGNVGQGHPSTGNRTSGAFSWLQPTLPSSVSRTSQGEMDQTSIYFCPEFTCLSFPSQPHALII